MERRIVEEAYGPDIRSQDWEVRGGRGEPEGRMVCVFTAGDAVVTRTNYPLGGGGDVEVEMVLELLRMGVEGRVGVHFNSRVRPGQETEADGADERRGFWCALGSDRLEVSMGGVPIGSAPLASGVGKPHRLRLRTLHTSYEVSYNDALVVAGTMAPPYTDNEGTLRLWLHDADVRIVSCREWFIDHGVDPPQWQRESLRYRESFSPESLELNWLVNRATADARAGMGDGKLTLYHKCTCFLKQRFAAPVVADFELLPLQTSRFSSGVTDLITLIMVNAPGGDLDGFWREHDDPGAEDNDLLRPLLEGGGYWVDYGGTNNMTSRLRRNPRRHLMRQYTDRARLLDPGRTLEDRPYRVSFSQVEGFVEYRIDDSVVFSAFDPEPYTSGHVGVRAFCAPVEIRGLEVWSVGTE